MMTFYNVIQKLFEIVGSVAETFWQILTTPIIDIVNSWNLPLWLDTIVYEPLYWIFGPDGTLLTAIPALIGILLLIRLVMLLFGRS